MTCFARLFYLYRADRLGSARLDVSEIFNQNLYRSVNTGKYAVGS